MYGTRTLLVVGGGIAAYKALELVRLVRRGGGTVRAVLTPGGARFVTPLSLAALTEGPVYQELWDLKDEAEMGHIRLSREADLIVVAPASADRLARMAAGLGGDLADAVLLAADKPVLCAPAMNHRMWLNPATVANVAMLRARGVTVMEPDTGAMACGETGPGRLPEPDAILAAMGALLGAGPLAGCHALVTAGPTHEAIDPVRYIGNRSSGRQGFAVAAALAALGARVTLVAGPVALATPTGCARVDVVSAREMAAAVEAALPADIAVMVAAVADWGVEAAPAEKLKKADGPLRFALVANPDILARVAGLPAGQRPRLVVGFAAETGEVAGRAAGKLAGKGADLIVGNDVSGDAMGGADNAVVVVDAHGAQTWPRMGKAEVATRLAARIAQDWARLVPGLAAGGDAG